MATPEGLEARVAALEGSQADCRAVLTAVNAVGANQREHPLLPMTVETRLSTVETEPADFHHETRARFRSVDEQLAEIKDLILGGRKT